MIKKNLVKVSYKKYILHFNNSILTSRGSMNKKNTWILKLTGDFGSVYGECNYFLDLSIDHFEQFEEKLIWLTSELTNEINEFLQKNEKHVLQQIKNYVSLLEEKLSNKLQNFPSIVFGLEMLLASFLTQYIFYIYKKKKLDKSIYCSVIFPSKFTRREEGISINGLIWMGEIDFMNEQIKKLRNNNFSLIKIKIAALDFELEEKMISNLRNNDPNIAIRLDANGGFEPDKIEIILNKLNRLAKLNIHSIEQPVLRNKKKLAEIIRRSPIKIALDETLITSTSFHEIATLKPDYLILKPSLLGGWKKCHKLIDWAENNNIGWWITSALESNIGLNAIAQWTYLLKNKKGNVGIQGLGTGGIYRDNFFSSLKIKEGYLYY